MKNSICQVVFGLPVEGPFDYFVPESLQGKIAVGMRVLAPFGTRQIAGFIIGFKNKSKFPRLKSLITLLDAATLIEPNLLLLTHKVAQHYGCSWGEAIEITLPVLLRKKEKTEFVCEKKPLFSQGKNEVLLLHDPAHLRRWPVLCEHIKNTLASGEGVLYLAAEKIAVEQVVNALKTQFADTLISFDKKLSPRMELAQWLKMKEFKPWLIVGTRSAVFSPVNNLGLIIIEEENHSAFKQEQTPHYHARDVALMRNTIDSCRIIFASTSPSCELWRLVQKKKIKLMAAYPEAVTPFQIVDTSSFAGRKNSLLSFPLRSGIQKILETRSKVLLFLNRKGFSTRTRCQKCGFTLTCKRCDTNLTYLFHQKKMVCRHCNYSTTPPNLCPSCRGSYLRYTGMGLEKLESELARLFPSARLSRFEKDSQVLPADFDILLATQAVLKMKEKLSVGLVGLLQADSEMNRIDFRSAEKTFALLTQLRNLAKEKMIVQTSMPDNYCIKTAVKMDFARFYKEELKYRRQTGFPPFRELIAVSLRGTKEQMVFESAMELSRALNEASQGKGVDILEPQSDVIPKMRDKYRFTILLKCKSAEKVLTIMHKALKSFKGKNSIAISINVDP